ncbi:MAG: NAD(P)-binding domain-containing protein, partial [Thermoguttaceae bacterium]|nr:NAD(P)-binding domain-containing protein [Thermoguttaceae bacterium]
MCTSTLSSSILSPSTTHPQIGWIGTGVMGHPMVEHLLRQGVPVAIYNRTRSRAETLLASGAAWCDSPAEIAATSEIVCSIVGMPSDVESIYFGENGVFSTLRPNSIICDLTTSRPELAKRLAETARKLGADGLDAPVTGAEIGAIRGTLSIFVGGDSTAFERIKPVLSAFGQKILRFGNAGAGQQA